MNGFHIFKKSAFAGNVAEVIMLSCRKDKVSDVQGDLLNSTDKRIHFFFGIENRG